MSKKKSAETHQTTHAYDRLGQALQLVYEATRSAKLAADIPPEKAAASADIHSMREESISKTSSLLQEARALILGDAP